MAGRGGETDDGGWDSRLQEGASGNRDEIEVPEDYTPPEGLNVDMPTDEDEAGIPEELKGKSKAELARMLKEREGRPDPSIVVSEGLSKLADSIEARRARDEGDRGAVAPQQPGESDEDFWKRAAVELFDEKKVQGTFSKGVGRIVAPYVSRLAQDAMEARRDISRYVKDRELWDKYEDEIEAEAKVLVKQYGPDPKIYETAVKAVKTKHVDEIAEGKQSDRIKALEAEIAKLKGGSGDEEGSSASGTGGGFRHSGGGTSLAGGNGAKVKRIRITDEVREKARVLGCDPEDLLGID